MTPLDPLTHFFENQADCRLWAMTGSLVNPRRTRDKFTDYDVAFFTTDVTPYRQDDHFLTQFGEVLLQTAPPTPHVSQPTQGCTYLVQYTSGLRIDFQFYALDQLANCLASDQLTKIMADKDQCLPQPPTPSDRDYWTLPPTTAQYSATVREFWWQFLNTLKANCRHDFLLAQFYLNLTRTELVQLWTWLLAYPDGFERSYGKQNTDLISQLPSHDRAQLLATFDTSSPRALNESLRLLQDLMVPIARLLTSEVGVDYRQFIPYESVPERYLQSKHEPQLAHYFRSKY